MIEVELNKEYLDEFISDLRCEDKEELIQFYPTSLDDFSKTCFEEEQKIYFVLSRPLPPFICQKSLITQGSIEEFETLFAEKIVKK